ncbi:MAG: hypothetical protein ACREEM_49990 [Blastocatellia bacterium]
MRLTSFLLVVLLELTTPVRVVAVQQSTATQSWSALQALPASQELLIETQNNASVKGRFVSVTDVALVIERRSAKTELPRAQIKRVFRLTGKTRGRSALKGAGIGAAAGLSAGLIFYLPARDDNEVLAVPALTLIGAGIGAGLGALIGKGQRRELIYAVP